MLLFVIIFAADALARHAAFLSSAQDLGYFDQVIWTSSRGRPLHFTVYDLNLTIPEQPTFLAYHVEPLLLAVAPLYWLWDDARAILILQPIVLALAAVPAYRLGQYRLGSAWGGLAIGLLVPLNPTVQAATINDFHTLAFAPLLLLGALLALVQRRWLGLAAWCGAAILIKEQISLLVAMLGLAALVDGLLHRWPGGRRQAVVGAALLVGGLAWFLVSVLIVIPAAVGHGARESPFIARYGQYGDSLGDLLRTLLTRPDRVWAVTPKREVVEYWFTLVLGGGLLPLLSPLSLLTAPELAINSLSSFVAQRASATHYSLSIVAFIVAGAADGAARLAGWWRARQRPGRLALLLLPLLLLASLNAIDRGFLPGARKHRVFTPTARQAEATAFLNRIPPADPVTAQANLVPHLTHRFSIYPFAYGFTPPRKASDPVAEWVLLDVTAAEDRADGRGLEREALADPAYGVVADDNGYLLLRRGAVGRDLPPAFTRFALAEAAEIARPAASASADGRLIFAGSTVAWQPDPWSHRAWQATITSYWRVSAPLDRDPRFVVLDAANPGAPLFALSPTAVWFPASRWPPGQLVRVVHGTLTIAASRALTIAARDATPDHPALVQADLTLTPPRAPGLSGLLDDLTDTLAALVARPRPPAAR